MSRNIEWTANQYLLRCRKEVRVLVKKGKRGQEGQAAGDGGGEGYEVRKRSKLKKEYRMKEFGMKKRKDYDVKKGRTHKEEYEMKRMNMYYRRDKKERGKG